MRWLLLFCTACSTSFKPGAEPMLTGQFDKASLGPGESATLTFQTNREADYVIFVNGAVFARAHATAKTATPATVPATALQNGSNAVVVAAYTSDGSSGHLPLALALDTAATSGGASAGSGADAGSSSGSGASSGTSSGTSSGGSPGPFTVGGTIVGLYGGGLTLQLARESAANQTVLVGAPAKTFTFTTALAAASSYTVTITAQPTGPAQTCTLTSGTDTGTVAANVTSVVVSCGAPAATDVPRIFFTDLTQGPAGAFVSIYGLNFGADAPTAKVGAVVVGLTLYAATGNARDLQRAVVQIPAGTGAAPSSVAIFSSGGVSSTLPFTVTSGHIYSVNSATGMDTNDGSVAHPFLTLGKLVTKLATGDVGYLRAGTYAPLSWTGSVTAAIVGYPGETATITSSSGPVVAISGQHLTLANLTLGPTGADFANDGAEDVVIGGSTSRLVGNIIPMARDTAAGQGIFQIYMNNATSTVLFGNILETNEHGANGGGNIELGDNAGTLTTIELGFNELDGCVDVGAPEGGAMTFHSYDAGSGASGIDIHHNLIHACDRAELIGMQSKGGATLLANIHDNLMLSYGSGNGRGTFYVVFGSTDTSVDRVIVDHNTIIDNEIIINIDSGSASANNLVFTNNIVLGSGGNSGCEDGANHTDGSCSSARGPTASYDNFFSLASATAPPNTNSTTASPALDGTTHAPQSVSTSVIGKGTTPPSTPPSIDYFGVVRSTTAASDIGAIKYIP